jgi:hypothetical protein
MIRATSQKTSAWEDTPVLQFSRQFPVKRSPWMAGCCTAKPQVKRGRFWLMINMGVLVGALRLVFGTIFNSPMPKFLPFICVDLIVWGYYSQLIDEGCASFMSNNGTMLQLRVKSTLLPHTRITSLDAVALAAT